jgi:hypothetical protein
MRALLFISFLLSVQNSPVWAQRDLTSLEERYENYRARLFGYGEFAPEAFIKVKDKNCPSGQCSGYNIVFNKRNPYVNSWMCMYAVADPENPTQSKGWPNCGYCYRPDLWDHGAAEPKDFQRDRGMMDPGDGTIFLGDYMAYLATEWARSEGDIKRRADAEEKIFLAIKTIERLDSTAEQWYGQEEAVDGFFIRQDVPFEWLQQMEPFGPNYHLVAGCKERMRPACDGGEVPGNPVWRAMSQDQVIGLLFGLRMVTHFLPEDATATDLKTGKEVNIQDLAKSTADRILRYVARDGWIIKDPNGEGVCRGRNSNAYNWALAKAGKMITGHSYQDFKSRIVGLLSWRLIRSFYGGEGIYGTGPRTVLGIGLDGSDVNRNMMFKLAVITGSWESWQLGPAAAETGYELYDLANAVMWDKEPYLSKALYEEILMSAPVDGPKKFTASLYWEGFHKEINALEQVRGWDSPNRFSNPGEAEHAPSMQSEGEYPGMDFLLLYNLYCLQWNFAPGL